VWVDEKRRRKISQKIQKLIFFYLGRSIYQNVQKMSNFKKPSEWMLVSLTFLKKDIWEIPHFLRNSKVWGLIIKKIKRLEQKVRLCYSRFFLLFQRKTYWLVIFSRLIFNYKIIYNLFALKISKILKKMLKIAK